MNALTAMFKFFATLFGGMDAYASAFAKTGTMADRAMDHQIAQQDLVHAERMISLMTEAQTKGVQLSVSYEQEEQPKD